MDENNMKVVTIREVTIGEGIPKICVPLIGTTKEAVLEEVTALQDVPYDLLEWRVDRFASHGNTEQVLDVLETMRTMVKAPILFTIRTQQEGGDAALSVAQYCALNLVVASSGLVDLIDVEVGLNELDAASLIGEIHNKQCKVVGSHHNYTSTPIEEEIVRKLVEMETVGADIAKIAVMPQEMEDVDRLLDTTRVASKACHCPIVTISMTELGTVSRIAGEAFGSAMTFGAGSEAAEKGQIDATELSNILQAIHKSNTTA